MPVCTVDQYSITTSESPLRMLELCRAASTRWLAKSEIYEILTRQKTYHLNISPCQVVQAPSGTLILYDKRITKKFRADRHEWAMKKNGKAIREDHSKMYLKVFAGTKTLALDETDKKTQLVEIATVYAHGINPKSFHRRAYQLAGTMLVLVHYLNDNNQSLIRSTKTRFEGVVRDSVTQSSAFQHQLISYGVNYNKLQRFSIREYCPKIASARGGTSMLICTVIPVICAQVQYQSTSITTYTSAWTKIVTGPVPSKLPNLWKLSCMSDSSGEPELQNFYLCVRFGSTVARVEILGPCSLLVKVPPFKSMTSANIIAETPLRKSVENSANRTTDMQLCLVNENVFRIASANLATTGPYAILEEYKLHDQKYFRACSEKNDFQYSSVSGNTIPDLSTQEHIGYNESLRPQWDATFGKELIPKANLEDFKLNLGRSNIGRRNRNSEASEILLSSSHGGKRKRAKSYHVSLSKHASYKVDGRLEENYGRDSDADDESICFHCSGPTQKKPQSTEQLAGILLDDRSLERLSDGDLTHVCSSLLERTLRHLLSSAYDGEGTADKGEAALLHEINTCDEDGLNLLHYACLCRHQHLVEKLLVLRADPNLESSDGQTPMLMATSNGATSVIRVLLKHRANPNTSGAAANMSSLQLAAIKDRDDIMSTIQGTSIERKENRDGDNEANFESHSMRVRSSENDLILREKNTDKLGVDTSNLIFNLKAQVVQDGPILGDRKQMVASPTLSGGSSSGGGSGGPGNDRSDGGFNNEYVDVIKEMTDRSLTEVNEAASNAEREQNAATMATTTRPTSVVEGGYTNPKSSETIHTNSFQKSEDGNHAYTDDAFQQRLLESAFRTMTLKEKCALSLADPTKEHILFGSRGESNIPGNRMPRSAANAMHGMSPAERAGVFEDVELIQKNIRSWLLRRSYVKLRDYSKQLQAIARGRHTRRQQEQQARAATTLSKEMKKFMAKRKFQKLKHATHTLKSAWKQRRQKVELSRMRKLLSAAMVIQRNMLAWHAEHIEREVSTNNDSSNGLPLPRTSIHRKKRTSSLNSVSNMCDNLSPIEDRITEKSGFDSTSPSRVSNVSDHQIDISDQHVKGRVAVDLHSVNNRKQQHVFNLKSTLGTVSYHGSDHTVAKDAVGIIHGGDPHHHLNFVDGAGDLFDNHRQCNTSGVKPQHIDGSTSLRSNILPSADFSSVSDDLFPDLGDFRLGGDSGASDHGMVSTDQALLIHDHTDNINTDIVQNVVSDGFLSGISGDEAVDDE